MDSYLLLMLLFFPAIILENFAIKIVAKSYVDKVNKFIHSGTVPDDQALVDDSVKAVNPSEILIPNEPIGLVRQNHHALWRLRIAFVLISVVLAVILSEVFAMSYIGYSFSGRVIYEATLVHTWLCVPIIATYERWPRKKTFLYSLLYAIAASVITLDINLLKFLGLVSLSFFPYGSARNSMTSFLTITSFMFIAFIYLELSLLNNLIGDRLLSLLEHLGELMNSYLLWIIWIIVPSLLVFYQYRILLRHLHAAYKNKVYSEPFLLFTGVWSIALIFQVGVLSRTMGLSAYGFLVLWLLIPLSIILVIPKLSPQHQPPTLLVLRVFRGDDGIRTLFDRVVERWRYSGNTIMIAGADLALRNLDPDELLAFLSGQIQDKFISDDSRLQNAVQALDLQADPDGRYRINEYFCFDSTWKLVLATLVDKADMVLMDLRNYYPERKGCTHELTVLASKPHLQKLVLLFNRNTEKHIVEQLLLASKAKLAWIDSEAHGKNLHGQVLEALLNP